MVLGKTYHHQTRRRIILDDESRFGPVLDFPAILGTNMTRSMAIQLVAEEGLEPPTHGL